MGMDLAVAGVNHQPFKVGLVDQRFEKFFPYSLVTPADKPLVHCAPSSVLRRQVAPRRSCAQYPKNSIDKQTIISCHASPLSALPWQVRFQQPPGCIGDVMSPLCIFDEGTSVCGVLFIIQNSGRHNLGRVVKLQIICYSLFRTNWRGYASTPQA